MAKKRQDRRRSTRHRGRGKVHGWPRMLRNGARTHPRRTRKEDYRRSERRHNRNWRWKIYKRTRARDARRARHARTKVATFCDEVCRHVCTRSWRIQEIHRQRECESLILWASPSYKSKNPVARRDFFVVGRRFFRTVDAHFTYKLTSHFSRIKKSNFFLVNSFKKKKWKKLKKVLIICENKVIL